MGCFASKNRVAVDPASPTAGVIEIRTLPADSHLRKGMNLSGMRKLCKLIGFPVYGAEVDGYDAKYLRFVHDELKWITEIYGEGAKYGDGLGYDLGGYLRIWLKRVGKEGESVCTLFEKGPVTLSWTDDFGDEHTETIDLSAHIGPVSLFHSHTQGKPVSRTFECIKEGIELYRNELPADDDKVFVWLDYFSLKQCQNDFNLPNTCALVKETGFTLVELDDTPEDYLDRSFCVFETAVTVLGGAELRVQVNPIRALNIAAELETRPVNSRAAKTRSEKDKQKIDRYIEGIDGGFEKFDEIITEAIKQGAAAVAEKFESVTSINLANVGLNEKDLAQLSQMLKTNTSVTSLDLSGNKMGPEGIKALLPGLLASRVAILNFDDNNLTDLGRDMSGILELAEALPHSKLTSLSLADNQLCGVDSQGSSSYNAEGINALCEALKTTTTLTSLNLAHNYLYDWGCMAVAAVLDKTKITSLNLDGNMLGGYRKDHGFVPNMSGILKLVEALPHSQLTSLSLVNNGIANTAQEALKAAAGSKVELAMELTIIPFTGGHHYR